MFISITGNLGSGKSTICRYLAKKYGFVVYSTGEIHRKAAEERGISTMELNELLSSDPSLDNMIDGEIERISKESSEPNIVFDSRLAFHFADNTYSVFATVDPMEAARRVYGGNRGAVEKYSSLEETHDNLLKRSRIERERFIDIYDIDYFNYDNYDLIIDTSRATPEVIAENIYAAAQSSESGSCADGSRLLFSPKSLYPMKPLSEISCEPLGYFMIENKGQYISEPIVVTKAGGYHFIEDGSARMLAAVMNKLEFMDVVVETDFDEAAAEYSPGDNVKKSFARNAEAFAQKLHDLGISLVHSYEKVGEFKYLSYPKFYD